MAVLKNQKWFVQTNHAFKMCDAFETYLVEIKYKYIDRHMAVTPFSLNIFYFQQITSYTVQYIQFIRKLGLERKRKLIEFFYYRVHCDMEGGLYHINS